MVHSETRRLILERNACLVRGSQRLTGFFWERRRVPWPRISGGMGHSDGDLRDSVRARLLSGALFRLPTAKMWGGRSNGTHACVVCKERIRPEEMEYEPRDMPVGLGAVFAHLQCIDLWHTESDSLSQPPAA